MKWQLLLEVPADLAGERIDRALARLSQQREGPLSRGESRRLIDAGRVYLNGRRVKLAGKIVAAGDSVSTVEAEAVAEPVTKGGMDWAASILFEDDDLLVVNKPSGIPSQPTRDPLRDNAVDSVSRYLSAREGRQLVVKLAHRLDRDTSGVLVMTKSDRAISKMERPSPRVRRRRPMLRLRATGSARPKQSGRWTTTSRRKSWREA